MYRLSRILIGVFLLALPVFFVLAARLADTPVASAYTNRVVTYRDCLPLGERGAAEQQGVIIRIKNAPPRFAEPVSAGQPDGTCIKTDYYYSGFALVPAGQQPPVVNVDWEFIQPNSAQFYTTYVQRYGDGYMSYLRQLYVW